MQLTVVDGETVSQSADARVALRADRLTRRYGSGETSVVALDDVSVAFEQDRMTAIMGPSGSGKSTLMHCLAGLDSVTSGRVLLGKHDLASMSDRELTLLRREHLGFIFQSFNLLPAFTAEQNILLPLELAGRKPDRDWLRTLISTLGIHDRMRHRPSELSGGQQQRVAIARALVTRPDVVFCDEPTGSLDSRSGQEVLEFLRQSVDRLGQTVLMVTHDPRAAAYADRVVFLADGRIVGEDRQPTSDSVIEALRELGV